MILYREMTIRLDSSQCLGYIWFCLRPTETRLCLYYLVLFDTFHILPYVLERNFFHFVEWRVKKVPEALSVSKMAYQTLQQEYLQIPVVTRAYTTACVLTTAAVVRQIETITLLART